MFSPNFPHLDQYFGQEKIKTLNFLTNFSNFRLFFPAGPVLPILHHFQGYFESLSCDIYSKRLLFVESGRMRKSSSFFETPPLAAGKKRCGPPPGSRGIHLFLRRHCVLFLIFCRAFPQHSWLPSGPMTNLCPPAYRTPPSANLPLCLYDRLASALMTKKRRREETRGVPRRRSGSGSCGRWSGQPGDARPVKMGSSLPRSACFPTFSYFLTPNHINNLAILTPEV